MSTSMPPRLVTQSTSSSASPLPAPSGAMSERTPVEVSAWTTAMTVGCGWAASSASGSTGCPHGTSTATTSAPQRAATSHMRAPNTPFTPITTGSPGRTRLTKAASIPAEPVPETGRVMGLAVRNTVRSRSQVSSSTATNSGSRWPSMGRARAATASGYGLQGPGPIKTRSLSGMCGPDGRSFEEAQCQSVEDVGLRHDHLVEAEAPEQRHEHAAAAHDHVGAGLLQARVVDAAVVGLGGQRAEDVLGRVAGEVEVVDAVAVVFRQPDLHRGHGRDGPGQADQRAGLGRRRDLAGHVLEVGVDEADAGGQLLGHGRVVLEELLGHAHAAHVDRDHALDPVGAGDELGGAAADVHDEERP